MSAFDTKQTVGQLVAERPARARIFEKLGIDYCCGGKLSLDEVCQKKGLDARSVLQALDASEQGGSPAEASDWNHSTLTALCDHIVSTHHEYLRRELPRLADMTRKVAGVHGDAHPELRELRYTFALLRAELDEHMIKEERILFPAIKQIEAGLADSAWHCGGIDRPISVMEHEHDTAGQALARIRQLTGDFTLPPDGCNTYRVMLDALRDFEADLHLHIHKENNILFPRALELTRQECVQEG